MFQKAWKPAKIGRRYACSTRAAWAFIETSSKLFPAPNRTSATTSVHRPGAKATVGSPPHNNDAPTRTPHRLPTFVTSGPAASKPTMEPAASPNRPSAIAAVVSPRCWATAGTLAAQVAKAAPQTANTTDTPKRACRGGTTEELRSVRDDRSSSARS